MISRIPRLAIVVLSAVLLLVVLASVMGGSLLDNKAQAGVKPEISLSANGPAVTCDGLRSIGKGDVPKPAKCDVQIGEPFTLSIEINVAPAAGYFAWNTEIDYGALTYKKTVAVNDEVVPVDCIAIRPQAAPVVSHQWLCLDDSILDINDKHHDLGNIVELEFNCTTFESSNSIVLVSGSDPNRVFNGTIFGEAGTGTPEEPTIIVPNVDSLGINCVTPPDVSLSANGPDVRCDGLPSVGKGDVPKPEKCDVFIGAPFTVSIEINSAPLNGYQGWQTDLDFGALIYKKTTLFSDEIVDPSCVATGRAQLPGRVLHGCNTNSTKSHFVGNIVELEFNCTEVKSSNSIDVLPPAIFGTEFIEFGTGNFIFPNFDSLGINCVNPPEISLSAHGPKVRCDGLLSPAKGEVPKPEKCDVLVGAPFTVSIEINSAPPNGYQAWTTDLGFGALTYKKTTLFSDEIVDPSCIDTGRAQLPDRVLHGCDTNSTKSHFVGNIVELEFNCTEVKSNNSIDVLPPDPSFGTDFREFGTGNIIYPILDSLGINCVNSVKLPHPGDTDGDGCSDQDENRPKSEANQGGGRDWQDPWDFYDVAIAGAVQGQDQQIDLFNDIVSVIDHYAPVGNEPEYDAWYDRGPSAGPNGWNMTAPDGKIDLFNDIVGVINQFGHDCR